MSKIMASFTLGLENINVTNAVEISSKKMGSTKLPLPNLQSINPEYWLYIIQSYFNFMQFICFLFIYLSIYIFLTS